ncbi:pentatricopeptide repeat domain-containing protein [Pseudomassariella vexata]|uniref:Pentatricopeptide repeat domain-containing protein n=1 Tax=Pseudomassariella vexata TaxID=1141098 RepID=A0A1Y2EBZ4_9PEZI|nr:pentatricopeptide repeat domain-containing protein [Pseudomassariella vexata]ORY68786.1 pentatricopeptide repeat domain-containing protein [Pseudomassariella vexata]
MRSQLTRHVLRRLLAHHALVPPCPVLARPTLRGYPVISRVTRSSQRRTFLEFFRKPPRAPKDLEIDPGYEILVQYWNHKTEDLRLPSNEELVAAFREFCRHKKMTSRQPLTATQVRILHNVLNHLCHPSQLDGGLTVGDLRTAREVVLIVPRDDTDDHVKLSKFLFAKIRKMAQDKRREVRGTSKMTDEAEYAVDLAVLLRALTQYGRSTEARQYLLDFWAKVGRNDPNIGLGRTKALWIPVLRGLAQEGNETQLLEMLDAMEQQAGLAYNPGAKEIVTTFYAQKNEFHKMKDWFTRPVVPEAPPTPKTYQEVFRCAVRNNHKPWAISLYQDVVNGLESLTDTKYFGESILLIYQGAVILLGKGADHIEHMMTAYSDRHPFDPKYQPSIETINGLIETAVERNDAYLAERLVSLISKLGLKANRQTHSLQMEYRIRTNDLDGAFSAYRSLQNFDGDRQDWPALNKLIRAMCTAPTPNHERVLDVVSHLEQDTAVLEAETVVAICMTFLKNDEHFEVIDTLSLHTVNFSQRERQMVCKSFVGYCLETKNTTARVWDAYALLRQFFPDTQNEDRVKIMDSFFRRKRPDMACFVFGHMRQAKNPANRPTLDTYVQCFEGIGRCPDIESLKIVHNMLKMDTTVVPNTQLHNALMIAYAACEEDDRALDFWQEISNSVEGPSYNSLEIVFRIYQINHNGDKKAKALWEKMEKMEIDVPPKVYAAYAGAVAAHSNPDEAKKLLVEMEAKVNQEPDTMTLAVVYNRLANDEQKDDFEKWAQEEFPHIWTELAKTKRKRDSEGLRKFRMSPPWKA